MRRILFAALVVLILCAAAMPVEAGTGVVCPPEQHDWLSVHLSKWLAPAGCVKTLTSQGVTRRRAEQCCSRFSAVPFFADVVQPSMLAIPAEWDHHTPSAAAEAIREMLAEGQEIPNGVVYQNRHTVTVLVRQDGQVYKFVYGLGEQLELITHYQVEGAHAWVRAIARAVRGDGMVKTSARAVAKMLGRR